MYLMVTHIPIFADGSRYCVDINWQRDLLLARDWLAKPVGGLVLLAPSLPADAGDPAEVMRLLPVGDGDGIRVVPSFDLRCSAREFWLNQRRQWLADVRKELREAKVIHTSASDVYRPLAFLAHDAGLKSGAVTVLVGPDMDPHVTVPRGARGQVYCLAFDHYMRRAVARADVAFLKEGLVHDRYARYGKNVRAFCHPMHTARDVLSESRLESRLRTLGPHRAIKAVYAGRLVRRKGLHDAIATIGEARRQGLDAELDVFGAGPEESSLRRQVGELGVGDRVRFRGFVEYGHEFIARLASYDLLLFMPTEEDTPRMLYDAMAAGLPLLGSRIPFLEHRISADRMGVLVGIGDSSAAASELRQLSENPERLKALSRAARAAGQRHTSEEWMHYRAECTREALERRLHRRRVSSGD